MSAIHFVDMLSFKEQSKLVEIAHETTDLEIRRIAMAILQQYYPPMNFVAEPTVTTDLTKAALKSHE